jgi:methylated-DNA-protein-cysteine methyltransferase related protein
MPRIKKKLTEPNFFEDVYEVVKLIPKGRVTSYGAIAHYLGAKSSSRMVGWSLNKCPKSVPAHRVVNRNGLLTGKHNFMIGKSMEQRLQDEGVEVIEDQIKDFKTVFWDPQTELSVIGSKKGKNPPKTGRKK